MVWERAMQPLGTGEVKEALLILCMFVSKSGRTLSGKTPFTLLMHHIAIGKWPWIQQYAPEILPCDGSALCFKHSSLLLFPLLTFLLPDTDTHREMGCFHACVITIATISHLPARVEALQCSVLRTQRGHEGSALQHTRAYMHTTRTHDAHTCTCDARTHSSKDTAMRTSKTN